MSLPRFLPLILLPLALAGCQTIRQTVGLSDPDPAQSVDAAIPSCPVSAVLSDAARVTKVKPGTPLGQIPNPANVVIAAEMSQAQLTCEYDRTKNTLSVDISFAVRAARGGAAAGSDPALDYFVAIVDFDNNILSKKLFQSHPNLGGKTAGTFEETVGNFAVPLDMDKRPYDYEILTGFQLTPDELALNRVPKPILQPRK